MDVVMFLGRPAGWPVMRWCRPASASAIPGLREALLHEPASASDPRLNGSAAHAVAELHFDNRWRWKRRRRFGRASALAGPVSTPGSGRRTSATRP